jgi:ArsR family transcriptional regulator, lead/cadmium/zinc/bismuth-responsive transcriptional repressor
MSNKHDVDVCQTQCVDMSKVVRVRASIPNTDNVSGIFKALADNTRLQMAYALLHEEMCVCEVAELLQTTVQNASHHLRYLKKLGMATFRRDGKLVYYRLVPEIGMLIESTMGWERGVEKPYEPSCVG